MVLWHKRSLTGWLNEHQAQSAGCGREKKIVLLINGVIKVLSLTCHQLTAMDELLGPPPGSRTFDNEWQLLAARLGGDWATCMGLAPPPPVAPSLSPIALNLLTTFGLPISDLHFPFSYFILISSTRAPLPALN